jgi:hypothetical protein
VTLRDAAQRVSVTPAIGQARVVAERRERGHSLEGIRTARQGREEVE